MLRSFEIKITDELTVMEFASNDRSKTFLPVHYISPMTYMNATNRQQQDGFIVQGYNLTLYNFSAEEFWSAISDFKNYKVLDSRSQAIVIFSYVTLIAVGIVSNVLVCCVVVRQSKKKSSHVSGKSRNFYILNLALADLSLCCICLPLALRNLLSVPWTMGIFLCKLSTMIQATHMLVTAGTVSAIAIDRYNTIVRSRSPNVRTNPSGNGGGGVMSGVVIIWLLSLLLTSPLFFYTQLESVSFGGIYLYDKCVENWPSESIQLAYSIFLSSSLFIIPTFILSAIHFKISSFLNEHLRPLSRDRPKIEIHSPIDQKNDEMKVQNDNDTHVNGKATLQKEFLNIGRKESICSNHSQRSDSSRKYSDSLDSKRFSASDISPRRCFLSSFRENSDLSFSFSNLSRDSSKKSCRRVRTELKRNRRTTLLLSCIASIYAVSWLPYSVYNIVTNLNPFVTDPATLYKAFAATHLTAMTSVCVNPFLYGWLNTNFRCEFLQLFASLSSCFSKLFKKSSKIITSSSPYNHNEGGFGDEIKKKKSTLSFIHADKKSGVVRVALFADDSHAINI